MLLGCLRKDLVALLNVKAEKDFDINRKYEPLQMTLLHIVCKAGVSPAVLFAVFPHIGVETRDKVFVWLLFFSAQEIFLERI